MTHIGAASLYTAQYGTPMFYVAPFVDTAPIHYADRVMSMCYQS
jgi:hypothetical protein